MTRLASPSTNASIMLWTSSHLKSRSPSPCTHETLPKLRRASVRGSVATGESIAACWCYRSLARSRNKYQTEVCFIPSRRGEYLYERCGMTIRKRHGDGCLCQLLLGILDKATLNLGDNTKVDFSQTIVFMTSNLGAKEMSELITGPISFAPGRAAAG